MLRSILGVLCVVVVVGGCAQPKWSEDFPQQPTPGPEILKLSRLVGTWSGTAEMVTPSPEEMKAGMPEGSEEEMPSSFAGGGTFEWDLGGMFLTGTSWHEMGPNERVNYIEFWTWDAKAKKYRTWYFSDWGEFGVGTAEFEPDGDTLTMKSTSTGPEGKTRRGKGTMRFEGDGAYKWCWSEKGPDGKMEFKGTSTREK